MEEKLLTIEEVAVRIGVAYKTLCNWYAFKKRFPKDNFAKMLPDFVQEGPHKKRLWKESDLEKLEQFKTALPKGRGGVMGDVTQTWSRRQKGAKNGTTKKTD